MTDLIKPLRRRLPVPIDRRLQVATIAAGGVTFRALHSRRPLPMVAWSAIYHLASELSAQEKRAARRRLVAGSPISGRGAR